MQDRVRTRASTDDGTGGHRPWPLLVLLALLVILGGSGSMASPPTGAGTPDPGGPVAPLRLTLEGPTSVPAGTSVVYTGALTQAETGTGLPDQRVELRLDGDPVASGQTDLDGGYVAPVPMPVEGCQWIELQAVSYEGLPVLETRSPTLDLLTARPPGSPQSLQTGQAPGITSVTLTWAPPAEDGCADVEGYVVYRDGSRIAEVNDTSFHDTGLEPATSYAYQVAGVNLAGQGHLTPALSVTTATGSLTARITGYRICVHDSGPIECQPLDGNRTGLHASAGSTVSFHAELEGTLLRNGEGLEGATVEGEGRVFVCKDGFPGPLCDVEVRAFETVTRPDGIFLSNVGDWDLETPAAGECLEKAVNIDAQARGLTTETDGRLTLCGV